MKKTFNLLGNHIEVREGNEKNKVLIETDDDIHLVHKEGMNYNFEGVSYTSLMVLLFEMFTKKLGYERDKVASVIAHEYCLNDEDLRQYIYISLLSVQIPTA